MKTRDLTSILHKNLLHISCRLKQVSCNARLYQRQTVKQWIRMQKKNPTKFKAKKAQIQAKKAQMQAKPAQWIVEAVNENQAPM